MAGWSSESGQGNRSVTGASETVELRLDCQLAWAAATNSVALFLNGNGAAGPVAFDVDGRPIVTLPFEAGGFDVTTPDALGAFSTLVAALKQGSLLQIAAPGHPPADLSLSGSSGAIGACVPRLPEG